MYTVCKNCGLQFHLNLMDPGKPPTGPIYCPKCFKSLPKDDKATIQLKAESLPPKS